MLKIVSALGFRELVEDAAAEFPEFVDGPFSAVAEQLLELGKSQLDRVQVRRVGRQIAQFSADSFDRFADSSDLMAGEIVHHHDVAGFQDRRQVLLDPGEEQGTVDGSLDGQRSDESLCAQRTEKGRCLPTSARSFFDQTRAEFRTAVASRQVGFGPRFIDENDFGRIDLFLRSAPSCTLLDNIGTILLAGNQRLFFRDCSSARQALQIVITQTSSPRSCFNSSCSSRK